jgi:hypothetical protein
LSNSVELSNSVQESRPPGLKPTNTIDWKYAMQRHIDARIKHVKSLQLATSSSLPMRLCELSGMLNELELMEAFLDG